MIRRARLTLRKHGSDAPLLFAGQLGFRAVRDQFGSVIVSL